MYFLLCSIWFLSCSRICNSVETYNIRIHAILQSSSSTLLSVGMCTKIKITAVDVGTQATV